MRVVDVTQWYGPTSGGIRTYLHAKAAFAAANGLGHALVVPGAVAEDGTVSASPVVAVRGRTPTDRWGYRVVTRSGGLIAALDRLEPGLVMLHDCFSFPGAIASWASTRRVPVAMMCHSDAVLTADGLPRPLRPAVRAALRRVQRRGLAAAALVVIPSHTTAGRLAPDLRADAVHVPLGVDLGTFAEARRDPELHDRLAPDGAALVLHAGRLSSEKGVLALPRMLASLRVPARLAIAGTGALEPRLRREAMRLGVAGRMRMLGHVADRDALATLMASADCFVHPNPAEAFGLAPLEALAAGCPVVAPASGGCRENLDRDGCVLVPPGDPDALARGVEVALAAPRPSGDVSDLDWGRTFTREWELYRALAA